jgi:His-Xaa-Ser system radical SAM maturase HxsB
MSNYVNFPFNFKELDSNSYLVSNLAGQHEKLSRTDFDLLTHSKHKEITKDSFSSLEAKHFISPLDQAGMRESIIASKYALRVQGSLSRPALFMVVPTLRCDHDCHYCQVSRVPENKRGYDLEEAHIDGILEHIDFLSNNYIKIEFQGGEPLLNFDFIKKFYVASTLKFEHKQVEFVIATALGPINNEMLEWIEFHDIHLSVSFDGPKDIHSSNRPSKKFNSFENTVENIRLINKYFSGISVSLLSTITKQSLQQPKQIVDSYLELGQNNLFIRPLSPYGFASDTWGVLGYSADEFMLFYKKLIAYIQELPGDVIEHSALFHLNRIFTQSTSFVDLKSPAGVVFGAVCFDYNGNIFGSDESRMLWTSTKADELIIGRISDDPKNTYNKPNLIALLRDTFIEVNPGCNECVYSQFCGADPIHHLATQGDLVGHKARSFFCQIETQMFDFLFNEYYLNKQSRNMFDGWLSNES